MMMLLGWRLLAAGTVGCLVGWGNALVNCRSGEGSGECAPVLTQSRLRTVNDDWGQKLK